MKEVSFSKFSIARIFGGGNYIELHSSDGDDILVIKVLLSNKIDVLMQENKSKIYEYLIILLF